MNLLDAEQQSLNLLSKHRVKLQHHLVMEMSYYEIKDESLLQNFKSIDCNEQTFQELLPRTDYPEEVTSPSKDSFFRGLVSLLRETLWNSCLISSSLQVIQIDVVLLHCKIELFIIRF